MAYINYITVQSFRKQAAARPAVEQLPKNASVKIASPEAYAAPRDFNNKTNKALNGAAMGGLAGTVVAGLPGGLLGTLLGGSAGWLYGTNQDNRKLKKQETNKQSNHAATKAPDNQSA